MTQTTARVNKVWAAAWKLSICLGSVLGGLGAGGTQSGDSVDTPFRSEVNE